MSLRGSMPEFKREEATWLFSQPFWLGMSPLDKESWMEHRERVTMEYEDFLFLCTLEQSQMEQQDVVDMSRYHWNSLEPEEMQSLREYQHAWRVLGGGPRVAARLQVTDAPRTPPTKRQRDPASPRRLEGLRA